MVACLESLEFTRGTAWWPDLDGAVLVLETPTIREIVVAPGVI